MRVNLYDEELSEDIEIISKLIDGRAFTGLRLYLYLPVTVPAAIGGPPSEYYRGPFMHRPGDNDSAAVTFWSTGDLRPLLCKMITALDHHHGTTGPLDVSENDTITTDVDRPLRDR